MVGWTGKIDEWLNGEKTNYEKIARWLDGQEKQMDKKWTIGWIKKMDGWMHGQKKQMDGQKKG